MADLSREYMSLIRPRPQEPEIVLVPKMQFLMVDGSGDPNTSPDYQSALEALYGLAYTIRFGLKKRDPDLDFKVAPLEGLWWAKDMTAFTEGSRDDWEWTMMVMMPEQVTGQDFGVALSEVGRKKPHLDLSGLRLEYYDEGLCAQIMHLGPYSAEAPTIDRLYSLIVSEGYVRSGKHHEIYLGDPRRTSPERLKTVIRQPVARP